ncbi:peptidase, M16 family, partial [Teladorsagia circumcincta]
YRGLELTNGLRVLLVSDPTTDRAAAAMDVNVGSLMDPWEIQGLAHFCEHMLFLGTEKYPLENEFYKVQTIESELSKYLNDDTWRLMQVMRYLSKPGHDYGKFNIGSKKCLLDDGRRTGNELRQALLEFHNNWYSSNVMSLCIVGPESLDVMESLLKASDFGNIEDKGVERKEWLESPYGKEQLGKRVEVVPVEDARKLIVIFPIPDLWAEYKSSPLRYIYRIMEIVRMLTPQNMFYIVLAKKYTGQEGNILEPVYGTEVRIRDIEDDALTEDVSNAELAGLYCDITGTDSGVVLE